MASSMDPDVLDCTTRVTFDGRTVEYRSLDEIARALGGGHVAENNVARRPSVTLASFSRGGGIW